MNQRLEVKKGGIKLYDRNGRLEKVWTKEQICGDWTMEYMEEVLTSIDYILNSKDVTALLWGKPNDELGLWEC